VVLSSCIEEWVVETEGGIDEVRVGFGGWVSEKLGCEGGSLAMGMEMI
jgi:hypothetical protein